MICYCMGMSLSDLVDLSLRALFGSQCFSLFFLCLFLFFPHLIFFLSFYLSLPFISFSLSPPLLSFSLSLLISFSPFFFLFFRFSPFLVLSFSVSIFSLSLFRPLPFLPLYPSLSLSILLYPSLLPSISLSFFFFSFHSHLNASPYRHWYVACWRCCSTWRHTPR